MVLQLLICLGTLWGRGNPKLWGFWGENPRKTPNFGDGDGGSPNFGVFWEKIPENPRISGMGTGLQLLKCSGTLWGRGNPKFWGFFWGKTPKIPKFRGGDGGRNIGDFPHTSLEPV